MGLVWFRYWMKRPMMLDYWALSQNIDVNRLLGSLGCVISRINAWFFINHQI
jgi:hypothetical protein